MNAGHSRVLAVAYGEEAVTSYQLEMSTEIYDWLAELSPARIWN